MPRFRVLSTPALLLGLLVGSTALAATVLTGDQIFQGSLCVGSSCTSDEAFEFDTLRIKSATPVVLFEDTSSAGGSFPANDWSLGAEDGGSGRVPGFFIRDVTGAVDVLRVETGLSGGVAIGAGAALESGAVSVGSVGNERLVRHVAAATADTDAVNLAQFKSFAEAAQQNLPSEVSELDADLAALSDRLDVLTQKLDALAAHLGGSSQ